jgi:hypothetical protein
LRERITTVTIGFLLASKLSVNLIGGGLVVLGLALLVATLAFWRSAVEDPAVLAPLEIMADRSFARAVQAKRTEMLNDVRIEGAEPIIHHVAPAVLMREPISEPEKPFHDPYPHDDDAVDVLPSIIDPLLIHQKNKE